MDIYKAGPGITERFCEILWRNGKVEIRDLEKEEPFTYTNGMRGPGYISAKKITECPEEDYNFALETFRDAIKGEVGGYSICGIHRGMKKFSEDLARILGVPCLGFQPNKEERGLLGDIIIPEGISIDKRNPVIILEDVINNGTNTTAAWKKLTGEGFRTDSMLAICWYGMWKSIIHILDSGVGFWRAVDLDDILEYGLANKLVEEGPVKEYLRYLEDPEGWNRRWLYGHGAHD
jgi:orotate phosphoribosyltransferase